MARDLIRALANEVEGQPPILDGFSRQKLPRARKGSIFVGAGDSFAAALAGFHASEGRCSALDPYVLASTPRLAEGADVYFISVSGRTSSNVAAAKRVRRFAARTATLTAVADSRLAGLTDDVIGLPVPYAPRTPGVLSFSISLLAVLKIVGAWGKCGFSAALGEARGDRLSFSDDGTTYFLGNSLAHPVALYAAAKTYEILGARAHAELLEEFSHLELFSLATRDAVNGLACFDDSGVARRLGRALSERGYSSQVVPSRGRSPMERLFHAIFVVQLSVLDRARKMGLTEPKFLSSRVLEVSDLMIY